MTSTTNRKRKQQQARPQVLSRSAFPLLAPAPHLFPQPVQHVDHHSTQLHHEEGDVPKPHGRWFLSPPLLLLTASALHAPRYTPACLEHLRELATHWLVLETT